MTTQTFDQMKERMKAPWMAGDMDVITSKLGAKAASEFADRLTLAQGAHVLDVACGSGGSSIPLARRGMVVTGVDMIPAWLTQARKQAEAEGLTIQFDEGYAEQLPYADATFDAVITMFGVMFSSFPEMAAAELARVLKPGGLLAMASWLDTGFSGQMVSIVGAHLKPKPGSVSPLLWGNEQIARERLAAGFTQIQTEVVPIEWELDMGPVQATNFVRENSGSLLLAFGQLDEQGQAALASDLESHWMNSNIAPEAEHHTLVKNKYLQVTGVRR